MSEPTDRQRKSLSNETTFAATDNEAELLEICKDLCRDLAESMREENLKGRLLTLKTKTHLFEVKTKAVRLAEPTDSLAVIEAAASKTLRSYLEANRVKIRLMGVRMSEWGESRPKALDGPTRPANLMTQFLLRTFRCPACETDVRARDEQEFNSHLDSCLQPENTGSAQVDQGESSYCGNLPKATVDSAQNNIRPTMLEKEGPRIGVCDGLDSSSGTSDRQERISSSCVEVKKSATTGSLLCGSVSSAAEVADVTSDSVTIKSDKNSHGVSDRVMCPVCSKSIQSSDVKVINSHIDECLNVQSLEHFASDDRKRKVDWQSEAAHVPKKAKQQNSIKRYFAINN